MPKVLLTVSLSDEDTNQLQQLIERLVTAKLIQGEAQKIMEGAGQLITQIGPRA